MGNLSEHFDREEFQCHNCDCGKNTIDYETMEVLEDVRCHFNKPTHVNSGHRCKKKNDSLSASSPTSQHLDGRAVDIRVDDVSPDLVWKYLIDKYPNKYGIGRYEYFTHLDTKSGIKRRWDSRKNK